MKVKRFKVGNKYLYSFVRFNGEVAFLNKKGKVMVWTKKETIYLAKAMNVLGEDYIKQYYVR